MKKRPHEPALDKIKLTGPKIKLTPPPVKLSAQLDKNNPLIRLLKNDAPR